ncbi:MAG: sulfite exporter TauE/SafE family protein [Anaerolineaceae bacterium]|nr:sulfite exporter TauE/SafE family protein [Anaerolineaceae bacterium]
MEVNFWIAVLAGLASFLSPCVLSLVPVYLTYLSGRSLSAGDEPGNRVDLFLHGLSFVIGFSVVFILLGFAASSIGSVLYDSRIWIARIGGVMVILFGLHISGIYEISFLNYDLRIQGQNQRKNHLTSFLMGIFFSAGWSPCIGPVLGTILVLAANSGSVSEGAMMLTGYSIGMAIPFLLSTFIAEYLVKLIQRYKKWIVIFEKIFGALLIIIGFLLFLGIFERFAQFSSFLDIGL